VKKVFSSMSDAGRRFYSRIFNRAMLNIWAVRKGHFDTYLSETEDPRVLTRWTEELPKIVKDAQDSIHGEPPST